jgi:hypothetical protein
MVALTGIERVLRQLSSAQFVLLRGQVAKGEGSLEPNGQLVRCGRGSLPNDKWNS